MTLSKQRRMSLTEPAYAEVIRKTLEQFGKRKIERRRSLAAGEDVTCPPSPNLFNMFEENLMKNQMIEEESESESESESDTGKEVQKSPNNNKAKSDDPVYMIVLKQALKQRRQSLHQNQIVRGTHISEIIEEEEEEENNEIRNKTTNTAEEKVSF